MRRASACEEVMVSLFSGGFLIWSVTVTHLDGWKKPAPILPAQRTRMSSKLLVHRRARSRHEWPDWLSNPCCLSASSYGPAQGTRQRESMDAAAAPATDCLRPHS